MIDVTYINQGDYDYLGAELSINNQIICLIGITNDLQLFIEFFHDAYLLKQEPKLSVDYYIFLQKLRSCEQELQEVIQKIKNEQP